MRGKSNPLPRPWRGKVNPGKLKEAVNKATVYLLKNTDGGKWNPRQLFYTAKAIALYKLMVGEYPEVEPHGEYITLLGLKGEIHIPYKPIRYKGPFTRGYRYVKVDLKKGKYKIVQVKKKVKKVKKVKDKGN